jgi:hypothetical protein
MDANLLFLITLYDKGYEISMKSSQGAKILKDGALAAETILDENMQE